MNYLDQPETLFEEGDMPIVFYSDDIECPALIHYSINGSEFSVDCSIVKDIWTKGMEDDLRAAIDIHFKRIFFLSHRDLNLNIIGL